MTEREPWQHGTYGGYSNHGCRCPDCTRANRDYQRDYRARHPERNNERGRPPADYDRLDDTGGSSFLCDCPQPKGRHAPWCQANNRPTGLTTAT